MPLNLPCPQCKAKNPLDEPFPLPGAQLKCVGCGSGLAVSYPTGVYDKLRALGKRFEGDGVADPGAYAPEMRIPKAPPPPAPKKKGKAAPVPEPDSGGAATTVDLTEVDLTEVAPEDYGEDPFDRTVPSARSPYGGLPDNLAEPETKGSVRLPEDHEPTRRMGATRRGSDASTSTRRGREAPTDITERTELGKGKTRSRKRGILGCLGGMGSMGCGSLVVTALVGLALLAGGYWYFSKDLPTVENLREYEPATVTTVYDRNGELLGEIYEERRYVRPIEYFPPHVKNAFLAAEDAQFYEHGGVNYMGIVRAIGRGVASGGDFRGTSTITQQVAKNFLLTNERSITRKIKELLLSWRIEEAYEKDHILYLYLNEIYLGSQAYGVEAASRTYFGKSADQLTHGEAALLAGLPPRPSGYSPHKSWKLARQRQEYVVGQMVDKGHLTAAEGKAALAEEITIVARGNTFLEKAPHFTEHARRFLVERYGEDRVLHEGLQVTTTCDLTLQQIGQEAVTRNIFEVDQRMGFRREAVEEMLDTDAKIAAKRAEHEKAMRKAWAYDQDAAGDRSKLPEKSVLAPDNVYKAVILEVNKKWAKVGIGDHEAVIPLAWSEWVYKPDPERSWRYRDQDDLTKKYDYDDDRKADTPILKRGDVVLAKVVQLSTKHEDVAKAFKGTPGENTDTIAARLWQVPEVEGALLSMDVHTGAVLTMVGGADFRRSQLNRTVQSRRQVGSTFKPIVYAAAIESKRITAASMVADAPLAKASGDDTVWKPGNYGNDYLGNITLRQALAMSRNTCTVRVLESVDPAMTDDVIYEFGRRLGIGGIPLYRLPPDHQINPDTDQLCPWIREESDHTVCNNHWPPRGEDDERDKRGLPCRAELKDTDEHYCRACDMSMALGSASITMEEMVRAYSAFATGGMLIEPYYITEVKDRKDEVLYQHEAPEPPRVLAPEVAAITTWLLQNVVQGGTASAAMKLGLKGIAGKTGTTNDEKDAWFIGFTNDVITAVWVGFDQPAPLGVSSTGGRTALPIWMDYMKVAAPKEKDRPFPMWGDVQTAQIDEATGRRVDSGGRPYPFLPGTVPESTGIRAGQLTVTDVLTEL
ncbi:MAG: transglycosylase domain-containing protein [Alphaproteobacteria bacterium]|nr:transglycosylase domain-containing protein [Alphaproteobacteria bacterium]